MSELKSTNAPTIYELPTQKFIVFNDYVDKDAIQGLLTEIDKRLSNLPYDIIDKDDIVFPWYIVLNSEGGYVAEGLHFFDTLQLMKGYKGKRIKFRTVASGLCESMAAIMFLAGDERYMLPNAQLMFHDISAGFEGKYEDIKQQLKAIDNMKNNLRRIIKTTIPELGEENIEKLMGVENYITATEAINYNIATGILGGG